MKYPYTTHDSRHQSTPDCEPRTRRIGAKFWLTEWHRSQHIQQYREGDGDAIMKHATHGRFIRVQYLVLTLFLSVGLSLIAGTLMAQEAKVTSLMSKDLKDFPGKELLMIAVEHVPGGSNPAHRHNAHAMLYVLEGSVVMQVKGGKEVTLTPGQTFYEGPDDIHVVDRNASKTQPAKFVVFLIKDKGAPALIPVK
jgi:quercetin dioxygenase-like cupin family protein